MSIKPKSNRDLWILFSVIALDLVGFGIVVPILPFYAEQYGASASSLGLILTSFSAMQFLFAPFWGRLSDRIGRRPVLILTMGGSCLSLILLGLANSLILIFAARLLGGFFAANISIATAYVTDVTSDEERSRGMGLIGAAFGVGFLLGPALGGGLSEYGYSIPILVAAVLTALNMIYASLRLSEPPKHHVIEEKIQTSLLKHPGVFKICLVYFLFTLAVNQLESIFAFFMMDRFAYDARQVSYLLVLMAFVMILIQGGLIRKLSLKFGERNLLLAGSLLLAFSILFLPFSPTVLILLIPLVFSSIGRGISQPSMMSLVSKKAPPSRRGAVMGTFQASGSLGRVVGPLAAGLLYDFKFAFPFYFAAVLLFAVFLISSYRDKNYT